MCKYILSNNLPIKSSPIVYGLGWQSTRHTERCRKEKKWYRKKIKNRNTLSRHTHTNAFCFRVTFTDYIIVFSFFLVYSFKSIFFKSCKTLGLKISPRKTKTRKKKHNSLLYFFQLSCHSSKRFLLNTFNFYFLECLQ